MLLEASDLDGLPDFLVASAARLAAERGHPGRYAVTLARSSVEPFLQFSARRDLREAAFRAWGSRGENGGATDNRAIAAETVRLRAERARLLGYESHAHYRLADAMAKTPRAALDLLEIGLDARRRRRTPGSRGVAGDRGQRGRQLQRRAVGLALSRREAPQGGVRFRRERDKALPSARPDDRSRLLRGGAAVRRELRRAVRCAAPSPRCARLDGRRARRRADRALHRRLFRPSLQAQRRLDEQFSRAAEARRTAGADRDQRDEFRQGRRRRAEPF